MYDIIQEGVGRVPEKLILADRREVELNKVSQADPTGNKNTKLMFKNIISAMRFKKVGQVIVIYMFSKHVTSGQQSPIKSLCCMKFSFLSSSSCTIYHHIIFAQTNNIITERGGVDTSIFRNTYFNFNLNTDLY